MASPSAGSREMTLVKIRMDMPLPIPRWVTSSPSHMIMAVPAVSVMTISATRGGVNTRITSKVLWNRNTSPVDCRSASVTVM
jgi:hypothetical protein